jgi:phenylpropionate dioxygenase-like ring-hydroxylating dioxygenase large terminal subunit
MAVVEDIGATDEARKRGLLTNLGPGAHQCWYPVALSKDVPKGKAIGTDLGDGRIVIYRGEDGETRAMSAYCRHMGADLTFGGEVIGNHIRCPYHHWSYGDGGQCKKIPSGDPIPGGTSLVHLPLKEQFGLIWVFFGKTPLYELQTFDDFDDEKHVARACEVKFSENLRAEPWIVLSNIYDIVHLRFLHGMKIVGTQIEQMDPYRCRMSWKAEHTGEKDSGSWSPEIDVYGMNGIRTKGEMDGRLKWYIAASTPCGRRGTRMFLTIITTKDAGAESFLDRAEAMHNRILNEDLPILNNMRFGALRLVKSDRDMGRFIRAAREYPRTTLDELEAASNAT